MKYSTKLSDTVHVMVLIAINQEKSLSSASIAESVHTNPGFVRQLMLKLKKAGLMTSVAGHARPSLSKPADQITLLDIYKAVEGEKPLLHLDTHTNPDCGIGINIQLSLQGFYDEIQKTAEGKMNTITLQDIINTYYQRTSMGSREKSLARTAFGFSSCKSVFFPIFYTEIFFFCFILPCSVFIQWTDGKQNVCMRIVSICIVNSKVSTHAHIHKILLNKILKKRNITVLI